MKSAETHLTTSRLSVYQIKGAEIRTQKSKKRLVEEKASFKNRKLKSRKTGNTRVLLRLGLNRNSVGSKAT